MEINYNAQDLVVSLHREYLTLKNDTKVNMGLVVIRGEEGGV